MCFKMINFVPTNIASKKPIKFGFIIKIKSKHGVAKKVSSSKIKIYTYEKTDPKKKKLTTNRNRKSKEIKSA